MRVITVNHGKVFGHGNWYTFYCGKCERQIKSGDKKCEHCREPVIYKDKPKETE